MNYQIVYSLSSHTGRIRKTNQDNYYCAGLSYKPVQSAASSVSAGQVSGTDAPCFCVFDGLGGEECGDTAAYLASITADKLLKGKIQSENLYRFCQEANLRICQYARKHNVRRMGTTAAILSFSEEMVLLCNIGDSRIYRSDGSVLQQLSRDHVLWFQDSKGPLTQALGTSSEEIGLAPYIARGKPVIGEKYLLCTDGLTDFVPDTEIQRLFAAYPTDKLAGQLSAAALRAGGGDNITAIVCEVTKDNQEKEG